MREQKSKVWCSLVLALVLIGLVPSLALAQTTSATISGTATDETGGVLPGVTVSVENVATGLTRTTVSDDEGRFTVLQLVPGDYQVQGELIGFQTAVRTGITLTVGRSAIVDLTLQVGEITDRVTVTGEAPLVETSTAALSGLVAETQIKELPLNGRNFVQLSLLEPGATHARTASQGSLTGGGLKMSFNGSRPSFNNFIMDGTSINSVDSQAVGGSSGIAMGVETIREFQVITSNFSAEFGRAGGGIVNVVTKSGTNEVHGSVFYFHRNDNLDATNYFTNRSNLEKPEFKRNQFGMSLGGPIIKDKTFIFGGYEGLREGLGRTFISNTWTPEAKLGVFPDETVPVEPEVLPYLDLWPDPTPGGRDFGDGRAEFLRSDSNVTEQDFYQVRVDHVLSDSDSLFGRYTIDDSVAAFPTGLNLWKTLQTVRSQYVTIEEKKIFSPTLLNVFRVGYNRTAKQYIEEALDSRVSDPALWFIPNPAVPGLGGLGVNGLTEPGGIRNFPRQRLDNVFIGQDTVNYSAGIHSLKIGGEVQRIHTNANDTNNGKGVYQFPNPKAFFAISTNELAGSNGRFGFSPRLATDTAGAIYSG